MFQAAQLNDQIIAKLCESKLAIADIYLSANSEALALSELKSITIIKIPTDLDLELKVPILKLLLLRCLLELKEYLINQANTVKLAADNLQQIHQNAEIIKQSIHMPGVASITTEHYNSDPQTRLAKLLDLLKKPNNETLNVVGYNLLALISHINSKLAIETIKTQLIDYKSEQIAQAKQALDTLINSFIDFSEQNKELIYQFCEQVFCIVFEFIDNPSFILIEQKKWLLQIIENLLNAFVIYESSINVLDKNRLKNLAILIIRLNLLACYFNPDVADKYLANTEESLLKIKLLDVNKEEVILSLQLQIALTRNKYQPQYYQQKIQALQKNALELEVKDDKAQALIEYGAAFDLLKLPTVSLSFADDKTALKIICQKIIDLYQAIEKPELAKLFERFLSGVSRAEEQAANEQENLLYFDYPVQIPEIEEINQEELKKELLSITNANNSAILSLAQIEREPVIHRMLAAKKTRLELISSRPSFQQLLTNALAFIDNEDYFKNSICSTMLIIIAHDNFTNMDEQERLAIGKLILLFLHYTMQEQEFKFDRCIEQIACEAIIEKLFVPIDRATDEKIELTEDKILTLNTIVDLKQALVITRQTVLKQAKEQTMHYLFDLLTKSKEPSAENAKKIASEILGICKSLQKIFKKILVTELFAYLTPDYLKLAIEYLQTLIKAHLLALNIHSNTMADDLCMIMAEFSQLANQVDTTTNEFYESMIELVKSGFKNFDNSLSEIDFTADNDLHLLTNIFLITDMYNQLFKKFGLEEQKNKTILLQATLLECIADKLFCDLENNLKNLIASNTIANLADLRKIRTTVQTINGAYNAAINCITAVLNYCQTARQINELGINVKKLEDAPAKIKKSIGYLIEVTSLNLFKISEQVENALRNDYRQQAFVYVVLFFEYIRINAGKRDTLHSSLIADYLLAKLLKLPKAQKYYEKFIAFDYAQKSKTKRKSAGANEENQIKALQSDLQRSHTQRLKSAKPQNYLMLQEHVRNDDYLQICACLGELVKLCLASGYPAELYNEEICFILATQAQIYNNTKEFLLTLYFQLSQSFFEKKLQLEKIMMFKSLVDKALGSGIDLFSKLSCMYLSEFLDKLVIILEAKSVDANISAMDASTSISAVHVLALDPETLPDVRTPEAPPIISPIIAMNIISESTDTMSKSGQKNDEIDKLILDLCSNSYEKNQYAKNALDNEFHRNRDYTYRKLITLPNEILKKIPHDLLFKLREYALKHDYHSIEKINQIGFDTGNAAVIYQVALNYLDDGEPLAAYRWLLALRNNKSWCDKLGAEKIKKLWQITKKIAAWQDFIATISEEDFISEKLIGNDTTVMLKDLRLKGKDLLYTDKLNPLYFIRLVKFVLSQPHELMNIEYIKFQHTFAFMLKILYELKIMNSAKMQKEFTGFILQYYISSYINVDHKALSILSSICIRIENPYYRLSVYFIEKYKQTVAQQNINRSDLSAKISELKETRHEQSLSIPVVLNWLYFLTCKSHDVRSRATYCLIDFIEQNIIAVRDIIELFVTRTHLVKIIDERFMTALAIYLHSHLDDFQDCMQKIISIMQNHYSLAKVMQLNIVIFDRYVKSTNPEDKRYGLQNLKELLATGSSFLTEEQFKFCSQIIQKHAISQQTSAPPRKRDFSTSTSNSDNHYGRQFRAHHTADPHRTTLNTSWPQEMRYNAESKYQPK